MTPKYKSLLLNAFLVGAKDDDHLIRASSLSNLAEVCRILGYKLGSIVSEVGADSTRLQNCFDGYTLARLNSV